MIEGFFEGLENRLSGQFMYIFENFHKLLVSVSNIIF